MLVINTGKTNPNYKEGMALGRVAFKEGKSSAPAQDKEAMSVLAGRTVGDPRTLPFLDGWIAGWHTENLRHEPS